MELNTILLPFVIFGVVMVTTQGFPGGYDDLGDFDNLDDFDLSLDGLDLETPNNNRIKKRRPGSSVQALHKELQEDRTLAGLKSFIDKATRLLHNLEQEERHSHCFFNEIKHLILGPRGMNIVQCLVDTEERDNWISLKEAEFLE